MQLGNSEQNPVSVILVVKNGADFIGEALASVVNGKLQPYEILVVDGGSCDTTRDIASSFPGVRIIEQHDSGIANAYNLGIQQAASEFVAFISHDDIWEPEKLRSQMQQFQQRPAAKICLCMVQFFLNSGSSIPPGFRPELLKVPVRGYIMEALVARKPVFEEVGYFNPEFTVGEDTDWFARARDQGIEETLVSATLVRKRVHGDNISLNQKNINQLLFRSLRDSIARKKSRSVASALEDRK